MVGSCDHGRHQLAEEGFAPAAGVVHELEEAQVQRQLLLRDAAVRPNPSLRSVGIFERSPGGCNIENKGLFGLSGSISAENVWAHDQGQIA